MYDKEQNVNIIEKHISNEYHNNNRKANTSV